MKPLVSIGIPIFKRLHYLPNILRIVGSQDYPNLELILSDNGVNGSKVPEIVDRHYSRPYKFRQNPRTVSISCHFNQIVHAASGEYFLLLADDDEISPNFISELAARLEEDPRAAAAIARQEILDESGTTIRTSAATLPCRLSGTEFIEAAWHAHAYGFECFATIMARTAAVKACGGYPDFTTGTHNDDALLIKLCLNGDVVFSSRCSFRWRVYDSSHGWSISIAELAKASREFLQFLDSDATVVEFARRDPESWAVVRRHLVELGWKTYYLRWAGMYRDRLPTREWLGAAVALPFIPSYYRAVARTVLSWSKSAVARRLEKCFARPWAIYRAVKKGRSLESKSEI